MTIYIFIFRVQFQNKSKSKQTVILFLDLMFSFELFIYFQPINGPKLITVAGILTTTETTKE